MLLNPLTQVSPAASPTSWPTRSPAAGRSPSRCPSDGWLHDEIEQLGGASTSTGSRGGRPGPRVFGEVRRLRRILDSVAPDVVHLHSSKAGLAGRLALRGRLPTIFQPHAWSFEAATGAVGKGAVALGAAGRALGARCRVRQRRRAAARRGARHLGGLASRAERRRPGRLLGGLAPRTVPEPASGSSCPH